MTPPPATIQSDAFLLNLWRLKQMDRLGLLQNQFSRVERAFEKAAQAPNRMDVSVAITDLQAILGDYFHFLERLSEDCRRYFDFMDGVESMMADPLIITGLSYIKNELQESCQRFKDYVEDIDGPQLLSWVHMPRYYLARAEKRLIDFRQWVHALERLRLATAFRRRVHKDMVARWPELVSQIDVLLTRLKQQMKDSWTYGCGRRACSIANQLHNLIQKLEYTESEFHRIEDSSSQMLNQIQQMYSSVPIADLEAEHSALAPDPLRGLIWTHRRIWERLRQARFDHDMGVLRDSLSISEDGGNPSGSSSDPWLKRLRDKVAPLGLLHKSATNIIPVLQSLQQGAANVIHEQHKRMDKIRQDLIRHTVKGLFLINGDVYAVLSRMSRFVRRLELRRNAAKFCHACGGAFLSDDVEFECQNCHYIQHQDCLTDNRCAICIVINPPIDSSDSRSLSRRLPVYLLLDCSQSMKGPSYQAMLYCMKMVIDELSRNPQTKATASVSIIALSDGARRVSPLTPLPTLKIPALSTSDEFMNLEESARFLKAMIDSEILAKLAAENYYLPLVFLFSNGDWKASQRLLPDRKLAYTVAIGCGMPLRLDNLEKASDTVLAAPDLTPDVIQQYFKLSPL